MKVHCPVCGAKLYNNQVCPYCKDVTIERIENASNKAVTEARNKQEYDKVVYSTVIPKDISKKKLWLFTVLLGWFGVQNFYTKKTTKGWFHAVAFGGALFFVTIRFFSEQYAWGVENGVDIFASLFSFLSAITFLLWIGDIISLLFHKFKVPVVLGKDTVKNVGMMKISNATKNKSTKK